MRSPASKPFRPTLVTMSSNLIWSSDNQQDLKLQQGLWQEGDQVIHPFASNCRSSSLKAEGTKNVNVRVRLLLSIFYENKH